MKRFMLAASAAISALLPGNATGHALDAHKELARRFLGEVALGRIDDSTITPDFSAWTASRGEATGAQFREDIARLTRVTHGSFRLELTGMVAEGNFVAVEAKSHASLGNGVTYENNYHFLVTIEGDRVRRFKSYFNTVTAREKLGPAFAAEAGAGK